MAKFIPAGSAIHGNRNGLVYIGYHMMEGLELLKVMDILAAESQFPEDKAFILTSVLEKHGSYVDFMVKLNCDLITVSLDMLLNPHNYPGYNIDDYSCE